MKVLRDHLVLHLSLDQEVLQPGTVHTGVGLSKSDINKPELFRFVTFVAINYSFLHSAPPFA